MTYPNPNYHGPCPYCGSAISVVIRDGTTVARCSHRGCGARGPVMRSTERAVELFRVGRCVPPAEKAGSGAAEASEPSPPPTAPPLLEWGQDGPRLSEYERKRLERESEDALDGVCDECGGYLYVGEYGSLGMCPACNGTGRGVAGP